MEISIRAARAGEGQAIGELTARAYADSGLLEDDQEYIKELKDGDGRVAATTVLVALADGELAGSIALAAPGSGWTEIAGPGQGELRMLSVAKAYRGAGIATALTLAAIDQARAARFAEVVLCSATEMTSAHGIYRRLGFARWPEKDWSAGSVTLLAYRMTLAS